MPNWCSNTLVLTHDDPAMIDRAEAAVKEGKLLQEFVPRPADQEENWYEWNVANWGTKWDVGDEHSVADKETNTIHLSFESAWAPPTKAYETLQELGFTVNATYYEPGMCFAGVFNEDGDDYYEYGDMSAQEVRDTLPSDLDQEYGISDYLEECESEQEDEE